LGLLDEIHLDKGTVVSLTVMGLAGIRREPYMEKPTIITHRRVMMKGLRFPTRSETYATTTARIAAVM
jgi:hypothetical protein